MTYREIYRFVVIVALTGLIACKFRKEPEPVFYNETFQWKIIIPENLTALNSEKWGKKETEDDATEIFAFYDGLYNAIEATAKPFNPVIDGDFLENVKNLNEMEYFIVSQIPASTVDTLTAIERIDNLDFYVFKIKITYPDEMITNMFMYRRLFDKQSFGLSIIYQDEEIGQKMLAAWENSTFEK